MHLVQKRKFFNYKAEQVQDRQTSMLWLSTEAFSYPNARKVNGASEADIVQMKM